MRIILLSTNNENVVAFQVFSPSASPAWVDCNKILASAAIMLDTPKESYSTVDDRHAVMPKMVHPEMMNL
jgi:hypothetical protein